MNAMLLRGYVTRLRIDDRPGVLPVRAYELDMMAPPGASGSPLFRPHPLEVAGVVYGEQDVQMGGGRPVTFAYAHHLSTLEKLEQPRHKGSPSTSSLPINTGCSLRDNRIKVMIRQKHQVRAGAPPGA